MKRCHIRGCPHPETGEALAQGVCREHSERWMRHARETRAYEPDAWQRWVAEMEREMGERKP